MGQQSFSSLNYLAEYTIRIAIVLVCIPKFGFYGIVLSYYASNVCRTVSAFGKPVKLPVFAFRSGVMSDFRCLQQHWHFKYHSVDCGCCMVCSSHGFVCYLLSSLTTLCSKVMGKSLRFRCSPKNSTFALLPDYSMISAKVQPSLSEYPTGKLPADARFSQHCTKSYQIAEHFHE